MPERSVNERRNKVTLVEQIEIDAVFVKKFRHRLLGFAGDLGARNAGEPVSRIFLLEIRNNAVKQCRDRRVGDDRE